jgi:hypothetical protein
MGTSKLIEKLDDFFDLSKKKQRKKHNKLLKMIAKLEKKKTSLHREARLEHEAHKSSDRYHDLTREMKVISELIKKAKKHDVSD